jgi:hypothetical protein
MARVIRDASRNLGTYIHTYTHTYGDTDSHRAVRVRFRTSDRSVAASQVRVYLCCSVRGSGSLFSAHCTFAANSSTRTHTGIQAYIHKYMNEVIHTYIYTYEHACRMKQDLRF